MNLLRFPLYATEHDLRLAVVECGHICYTRHLLTANDGNISVRLDDDHILITPSGLSKGRMEVDDLVVLDLDSEIIKTHPERRHTPSSELPMHLEVYKQRSDIHAVIHAHPPFVTALTVADIPFPHEVLPEVLLTLGEIPTTEYATPSSHENAEAIRELIRHHNAILLRQHGTLTVGKDLDEALIHLERLEHVAEVVTWAQLWGKVNRIPPKELAKLLAAREKKIYRE
ncbi:MAG: class II aldolase/adducin family protein [Chloroflexota bacterium]